MSYSAEITLGGVIYTYPSGTMLKNYFVANPAPGIFVFHYGDAYAPIADVVHLGPHHIKLVENGVTLLDADNDHHGWNQEWTHRVGPFVLRKSPADIVAAKLLPAYGPNGNKVGGVANYQFTGAFFDSAGVAIYMPTTGERPDIGMITDPAAFYMLTGQAGPMLAWARAGGTCPNHWHDKKTGLPVNIVTHPGLNSADREGLQGDPVPGTLSPYIYKGPLNPADGNYPNYADKWTPQPAHYCDMHYVAAIATEDPVLLRDLQNAAAFTLGQSAEIFLPDGRRVQAGEYRGVAHGLGMSIKARAATLNAESGNWIIPGFHQPSAHYDALLAPSVKYYTDIVATIPACATFNVFPQGADSLGPWQHGYLVMDLALSVLTGVSGAEPLFIFALKNTVARFSGKSGWPPAWSAYYITLKGKTNWSEAFDGQLAEAALDQATYNKLKADPTNGFAILGTAEYMMTDRAGLVFADQLEKLGLCNVRAQVPDFDAALGNVEAFFHKYGNVNPRVALADPGVIPPVVVPIPPPVVTPPPVQPPTTPPPTGGTMTTIVQGSSYKLTPKITAPPGAVHYGVKPGSWTIDKPDQAKLVPAPSSEATATVTANVDTTAEDITVKCDVFTDAAKTKTLTLSITLSDVLIEATAGGFDITPA